MKVLVVEDDSDLRTVIRLVLEARGHLVLEARHGRDAMELMAESVPDVVLADARMPVMDGAELVSRVRRDERLRDVRIVMVTGDDKARGKVESVDAWVTKPFAMDELTSVLARLGPAEQARSG